MSLSLEDKKAVVADVASVASNAVSAVVADYQGLTVTEMTQLRADARKSGVYVRVVRNTLAKRALEGTDFDCLKPFLQGPLFIAFSHDAPGIAARVVKDFAKDHDKLEVKALSLGGKLIDAKDIDRVAKLPTKDEAISILMSVMKAPITKFVQTLAAPHTKMVRTVAAIRDQKQAS